MTVQAGTIIARVRNQLIDNGQNGVAERWSDSELIGWINEGQRTILNAMPDSTALVAVISLAAGVRQALPANARQLLAAYRNMGPSGATPGNAPMLWSRDYMNVQVPNWPAAAANPVVQVVMYDVADRFAFYCYPPNDGTGTLEINYSQMIADCVLDTDVLTVQDVYQTPLFDYTMMRASQKDSDYAGGQALAAVYSNSFVAFLSAAKGG